MQSRFKLGYMPTRRVFFSQEDSLKYKDLILLKIKSLLPDIDIIDLSFLNPEGLLVDEKDAESVARKFIAENVDAVFCPHCNFGSEGAVAMAARRIAKPFLLWGPRDESPLPNGERLRDSQCGLFATSKVLQRFGVPFSYIVNSRIDDQVFEHGLVNFVRAANVVKHFTSARIGQVSTRPRDFYSVIVNEGELLEKFGIQTIPIDLSKIVNECRALLGNVTAAVKDEAENLKRKADFSKFPGDELVLKLAVLKLAVGKWVKDEGLDALAFQCWDTLQQELNICSCFVHAVLTEEGIPVACETDIHGAITSLMLQSASHFKEPTFFADLTIRHPDNDNAELLWHCGPFPPSLADGKCIINNHFVLPSHAPGVCNWKLKDGHVTLARLDGAKGKYSLLCGEGNTVEGPFNQGTYVYVEVNDWPLWEEKIIYGPYIHHVVGAYGSFSPVLYEASRYIDSLEFDPASPGLDTIKRIIRNGKE